MICQEIIGNSRGGGTGRSNSSPVSAAGLETNEGKELLLIHHLLEERGGKRRLPLKGLTCNSQEESGINKWKRRWGGKISVGELLMIADFAIDGTFTPTQGDII